MKFLRKYPEFVGLVGISLLAGLMQYGMALYIMTNNNPDRETEPIRTKAVVAALIVFSGGVVVSVWCVKQDFGE